MKNILFPTDFSDHARHAFPYALLLARRFGAKVTVLHAFGKPEAPFGMTNEEKAEKVAENLLIFVRNNTGPQDEKVQIDYLAEFGYASDAILKASLETEADLIALGTSGRSNALFGTTAVNVLERADCPVLVVPPNDDLAPRINRILFTTDFEFRDLLGINALKRWCQFFKASLDVVHVLEKGKDELAAKINLAALQEVYGKEKDISFQLTIGVVREEVEKYIGDNDIDLLAMITHRRDFMGRLLDISVTKNVARHVNIPMLVMKDNAYQFQPPFDLSRVISIA
jgi:nucleotide-binding universal stress UspA family protein